MSGYPFSTPWTLQRPEIEVIEPRSYERPYSTMNDLKELSDSTRKYFDWIKVSINADEPEIKWGQNLPIEELEVHLSEVRSYVQSFSA